ncbi:MAG: hypothetical protein JJ971_10015 [Balneolaceae bacterium]|nr:hypothetical protein [Balneolaceae bacterium]MBO6546418.1 hypothetical protein [Balneolaceae bacterium]MBO6648777.1 hypothetical protein [Balneolaceae bacterium]
MKIFILFFAVAWSSTSLKAQYEYEPSEAYPFGRIHPHAPQQLADYEPLIGESICTSVSRAPDQTWNPEVNMIWRFKYIMNGMAVQDQTLKEDGAHSGSIRQFNADSSSWYVHYYSTGGAPPALPSWGGGKNDDGDIILYREQKAPNGLDGYYKITFFDISNEGFEWLGEWTDTSESFSFPTWKISCTKIE